MQDVVPPEKYRLVGRLGHGGTADVYLALALGAHGFEKLVVVKRLREDVEHHDAYREILASEARLAARLQHPNVVQTFEVGDHEGATYLVMEYLDGQPLNRVLAPARRGEPPRLPAELCARIVADALAGLQYAHDLSDFDGAPLGIVHRDVSPHNVFVTYDGAVKVVDFGIAKTALDGEATAIGVIKGKVAYMAPEQARGEVVDARADVFAMGIVLWEMLAARRLFTGDKTHELIRQVLEVEAPPLDVAHGVDGALAAIVAKMLVKDRRERTQSAAAARHALERWLAGDRAERGARDALAAWMQTSFGAQRVERREQVKGIVRAVREGALSKLPTLAPVSSHGGGTSSSSVVASVDEIPTRPDLPRRRRRRTPIWIALGATIAAIAAVSAIATRALWLSERAHHGDANEASRAVLTPPNPSSSATRDEGEPDLRLCGSNTIGAELAPAIVEAFFRQKGATVTRVAGSAAHRLKIVTGAPASQTVEIEADGTATGFDGLAKGRCDIAMASRAVNDEEAKRVAVAGFGDLRSAASEQVVGLDGIAVVVHPNRNVSALTLDQLARVFSGDVTDWSTVGGSAGPIRLYARDDNSGTFDTFKHLVLGKRALVAGAARFADSEGLADAVASDAGGIGFIGLAYVRSAKAVAVSAGTTTPSLPSAFTVTTESYPLSRRLFFYVPDKPKRSLTMELVSFALSSQGQAVVRAAGFVDLGIGVHDDGACVDCSARYRAATAGGKRLSVDFRFRFASDALDSRAVRDVDRLVSFMRTQSNVELRLLGFSDATGDAGRNAVLARQRAQVVADALSVRGLRVSHVDGFGAERPVASNDDESGRLRNRRVEAWIVDDVR